MKKQYLECGKIVATHGVRGELRVQPWCDSPDFLADFATLYLGKDHQPVKVTQARAHKNITILKLDGIDTVEQAVTLRGKILYINRDDAKLEEDEYFVQDLIGMDVIDADSGERYGELTDVFQTGANDVYQLTTLDGKQRLFPKIDQVVLQIDLEAGRITIRPLEGLFDDEN